ncbi:MULTISPECIES: low temperature requirement protein A [unclassified Pseudomonas]|uniref:low temperature requirement protein A n=1 Tax=unclassified Pseudomonas TaxID=196821 RepID=UPI002AC9095B|nr:MULTISPECIES: low temperature requirement protein A [unclassified Pseudomonas]MEB0047303.1 low temperature requirement protein A [Pseudomonas sp. Dout3]MEB0096555.1 low temperature requirement protein A [Pseudomonas sp. DC1.2]WPX60325.1 low temperature requirement protein A [Pseudomonas sp. DC1.2]
MSISRSLLRGRGGHDSGKVGMVELFFDLVFVFAITQLSHTLLAHLSIGGAVQVALMMVAVWWVWIFTSWITNWLDPEKLPIRLGLFGLMIAGLLLSSSIPKAFSDHGLMFAGAFVFMQVGRTLFAIWAVRGEPLSMTRNFQRILAWLVLSGVFWIAGAFVQGDQRLACWALALLIELISPSVYFYVPGLGRSTLTDWNVEGNHMAERCGLFVIIALGESLLVTGATFAELELNLQGVLAFLVAVLGSIAMWWVYFDSGAERAHHRIAHSSDPGRQARIAYTYLHVLIVAGVIVSAVADELVLVHPDHASDAGIIAIVVGPWLFLLGNALFKWVMADRLWPPLSHLVGLGLLIVLLPLGLNQLFSAWVLGTLTTAVVMVVAAWETLVLRASLPVSEH